MRFIDFSLRAKSKYGNRLYYLRSPFSLGIFKSSFWLSLLLIEMDFLFLKSSELKMGIYDERFESSHTRSVGKGREINVYMDFLIAETSQTMDLSPIGFEEETRYTFSLSAPPPFWQALNCFILADLYRNHISIHRIDGRTDIRRRKADAAQGRAVPITEEVNKGDITIGMPNIVPVL